MTNQARVCSDIRCQMTRKGRRADWFHLGTKSWYCFECAQAQNREALQMQLKYGGKSYRPCITEEEYTFKVLTEPTSDLNLFG